MNTYVKEIWEKALEILKAELTEVSFNTWIKSIDPLNITDSSITLGVRNDFTKDILENRYKDLIKNSIQAAACFAPRRSSTEVGFRLEENKRSFQRK